MMLYIEDLHLSNDTEAMEALHSINWQTMPKIQFDLSPIQYDMVFLDTTNAVELWADDHSYYFLEKSYV